MRNLRILSVLILLSAGSLFAQTFVRMEGPTKTAAFRDHMEQLITAHSDTIPPSSLPGRYRLTHRTSCPFTETIVLTDGGPQAVYSTGGDHLSILPDKEDSVSSDTAFPFDRSAFTVCLDEIEENTDTTTCVLSLSHRLVRIEGVEQEKAFITARGIGESAFVSFNEAEYVVLTQAGISSIGSQTSYGRCISYFFEKVEE